MNEMNEAIQAITVTDVIKIGLISLSFAFVFAALYLYTIGRNRKNSISGKRTSGIMIRSYHVFTDFFLTKRYVCQMRKRYEMICPEGTRSLMCKAMGMCYLVWGSCCLLFILLFGLRPSIYTAALTILSIVVLNHEFLEHKVGSMEMTLMYQMDRFLSDTRHSFYKHGMIDAAIEEASERSGRIMKVNSVKIQSVLESGDKETAIRLYSETVSNRFLRMFLSVAVYVSEFGDKFINGVSMFLMNINTIKGDIYIELMNRKETDYKFSGMVFTTLGPVYMLGLIKRWALSVTPKLAGFYHGTGGVTLEIMIYVITVVMYVMINELKEKNEVGIKEHDFLQRMSRIRFIYRVLNNYSKKNSIKLEKQEELLYRVGETLSAKQFLLKRLMYGTFVFLLCIFISSMMHWQNRKDILTSHKLPTETETVIPSRMIDAAGELVVKYTNRYKDGLPEETKLKEEIRSEGIFRNDNAITAIIKEIKNRSQQYKREYFRWHELLFAVCTGSVAYWCPYLMILYRRKVLNLNMGNEVAQFQSIIMLVMYLNNTTVIKVLELMESFAVIFKESIKSCINDYSAGDLNALEKLKMREQYEPFRRLVDNLIVADKIGIKKAFDEVAEERKVSQEMRNQEYRITRDKKVIAGTIMSFVPAVITVAFYWIIPFSMNALAGLSDYDTIMSGF